MYTTRLLEPALFDAVTAFPAVYIGGPRRAGKTTLARRLGNRYKYVLLDELDIRQYAAEDPRGFLERYSPPVIIDEIQNVPELLPYIKARIEADKTPGQWILTGSQQWALMKGIGETLAGRIALLHLYPFAISEIQKEAGHQSEGFTAYWKSLVNVEQAAKQQITAGDWITGGGYPEAVLGPQRSRRTWFSSYVQTYIDRDVRGNVREGNLRDFERFVGLLAARTAQQINTAGLASDIGVSLPTIKAWLSLLEASGLIFFLMPYHRNFGKRLIKTPKCYFMDTGLLCYLVGLAEADHAVQGPMAGALFETACVAQLYKRLSVWNDERTLYYFRSTDGLEVDLLVERGGVLYPIEIKLSSTIDSAKVQNLVRWREIAHEEGRQSLVISTSTNVGNIARGIKNIHFSVL
ncbi:MAG: ATP-binding protein [Candidatus Omnitrophica bacterium]|nr:ATP-binding protein [Candidatus Omnitrophota bacterium]